MKVEASGRRWRVLEQGGVRQSKVECTRARWRLPSLSVEAREGGEEIGAYHDEDVEACEDVEVCEDVDDKAPWREK